MICLCGVPRFAPAITRDRKTCQSQSPWYSTDYRANGSGQPIERMGRRGIQGSEYIKNSLYDKSEWKKKTMRRNRNTNPCDDFLNYSKKWIQNSLKLLHQILFLCTCTIARILVPPNFIANHSCWCETLGRRWDDTRWPFGKAAGMTRSRDLDEWGWGRYDQRALLSHLTISNFKYQASLSVHLRRSAQMKIRCPNRTSNIHILKGES